MIVNSFPCDNETCEVLILEQTECPMWSCYKYIPSGGKEINLTIIGIIAAFLSFVALVLMMVLRLKKTRVRSESELEGVSPQNIQESPQITSQTAIPNRNCYFTLASSSSDDYEDENIDERTPIIRRLRGPIFQE